METAAKSNLKKVSLELGGKSPLVVMDDVNGENLYTKVHENKLFESNNLI